MDGEAKYYVYGANGIIGKYKQYNHLDSQVCVTCRGNSCGEATYTRPKSWITGNSMVINFDDTNIVNKKFMYYYFKIYNFRNIISGSGQPQITRIPLSKLKVPLPSVEKQNYLVTIIDSFVNCIETLKLETNNFLVLKTNLLNNMFI